MLGSGPLKRASDRIQVLARVLLVALVLGAVPVALAVATAAGSSTRSVADAQSASRHRVTATLVEDAAPPAADTDRATPVAATWTDLHGRARKEIIRGPAGAKTGSTVTIWIDDSGDVTVPPLDDSDVVDQAVLSGVSTFLGISAAAVLGYISLRHALERSRMRRWAADWAVVEPVWSRKVP
jgi:hypothetical protein